MQTQNKETPERFFKLLQAGDLAFLDFMQYAIVVIGITKHGKTTFSHYVTGHPLQAYNNDGKQVHYRLVRDADIRSDARIGATIQSETEIPNKFPTNLTEGSSPIFLIDNPGQKDSFGINRVLSNAYFHYRIFSKIQNMKFILLFDYPTFSANIKETNEIFNLFFSSFVDFKSVKSRLLKSIVIVFSKVNKSKSMKDLHDRIKEYTECIQKVKHFDADKEDFIKNLLKQCIEKDKIKIFRQAEIGVAVQPNHNLLSDINSKLEYFSRDIAEVDEFESQYYQEKKTSMKEIKFSQSNRVLSLSQNKKQKNQTQKLFNQLSGRGKRMFESLFETLKELFLYILFDQDANQMATKNTLNHTEVIRQKRNKAQKLIIENLQKAYVEYDTTQKYEKRRQQILKRCTQCLKETQKSQNFIQRLLVAIQIHQFIMKYTSTDRFNQKSKQQIRQAKQDFQKVIFKVSQLFTGTKEIQILSEFLYNMNTYMNQIMIFCMIILPYREEEQMSKSNEKKIICIDERLKQFLVSLQTVSVPAVKMNDIIMNELAIKFELTRYTVERFDNNLIVQHYLKKFPRIIVDQGDKQDRILKNLQSIELSPQHKIHCQILVFKVLQKKYYFLTELKSLQEKKNDLNTQVQKNQAKCLIKSFVVYLKSVKKMKQLSQYKDFSAYKGQIYQINYLVWTYLVKLFSKLLEAKPISQAEEQFYKEILIEILLNSRNYSLIQEVFDNLLSKYNQALSQITMKNSASKMSQQTQKKVKLFGQDSLIYFMNSKKKVSKQIIDTGLCYAELLHSLGLKDKSLLQCYSALKYTQFCPEEVIRIQEAIRHIKSKNQGFRIEEELKSISEFEASITTRKHLSKFLKENQSINQLQCTNYEFLK